MVMPSQTAVRNVGQWSKINLWEMEFLAFPNAVPGFTAGELFLLCQSVALPKRSITESPSVTLHGHTNRRAGRGTVDGNLAMTFLGTVDGRVLGFMKQWRDAIWAPDTGVQVAYADYIALIQLRLLDQAQNPYWFYNLKGVFLATPDHGGSPDGTNQNPFIHSLGLVYDDFEDGPFAAAP